MTVRPAVNTFTRFHKARLGNMMGMSTAWGQASHQTGSVD